MGGPDRTAGRVLDPVERMSEVLFGLIMALTFTGTIHAALEDKEDVRPILYGALGCNVAWGIVDAVMYLMNALITRGRARRALGAIHAAATPEETAVVLEPVLPDSVLAAMTPRDLDAVRGWLTRLPEPPTRMLTARDLRGAAGVFLLVTVSTFPLVVPFLFLRNAVTALRVSHAVALVMLFLIGQALGRLAGGRSWLTGLAMLAIGVLLAGVAIALGG